MSEKDRYQRLDDATLYTDCMSLVNYQDSLKRSLLTQSRRRKFVDAGIEDIYRFNREIVDGWVYCNDFLEKRRKAASFFYGAIDVVFSYAFYIIDFRLDVVQELCRKFLASRSYLRSLDYNETLSVRFETETPAFIGADMNSYGPFSKEDVARLPAPNASLLLKNGLAQLVSPEEDYSFASLIDPAKVIKISRYMEQFERLLEITKAGLESKFYRDHLNHMIRTYFLSLKLADIFGITRAELPSIIFASLFHDIALPLQEAYNMFITISEALEKTYDSIKISAFGLEFKKAARISTILAMLEEHAEKIFKTKTESGAGTKEILLRNLLQGNHGVLGALEAPLIFAEDDFSHLPTTVKDALLAISLHDSELPSNISFQEFPVLCLLMIADELQEWGRPVFSGHGYGIPMEYIELKVTYEETKELPGKAKEFSVVLNYEDHPKEMEPILQIKSKFKRLKCIILNDMKFQIIFKLPNYKTEVYETPSYDEESDGLHAFFGNLMVIRKWPQLLKNDDILWEKVDRFFCRKIPAEIRTIEINHDPTREKPKWFVTINRSVELSEDEINKLLPRVDLSPKKD